MATNGSIDIIIESSGLKSMNSALSDSRVEIPAEKADSCVLALYLPPDRLREGSLLFALSRLHKGKMEAVLVTVL